jgi:hypothetical protein
MSSVLQLQAAEDFVHAIGIASKEVAEPGSGEARVEMERTRYVGAQAPLVFEAHIAARVAWLGGAEPPRREIEPKPLGLVDALPRCEYVRTLADVTRAAS